MGICCPHIHFAIYLQSYLSITYFGSYCCCWDYIEKNILIIITGRPTKVVKVVIQLMNVKLNCIRENVFVLKHHVNNNMQHHATSCLYIHLIEFAVKRMFQVLRFFTSKFFDRIFRKYFLSLIGHIHYYYAKNIGDALD